MRKTLKSSRKNVYRKNKKTKKDVKHYSRKNKINKMSGGTIWEKKCSICFGKFLWPTKETPVFTAVQRVKFNESDSKNKTSANNNSNNSNNNNNYVIPPVKLDSDLVGELPCGHIFHKQCLEKWQTDGSGEARNKCPLCKSIFDLKDILKIGRQPIIFDKDYFTDLFDKLIELDMNNFLKVNIKYKKINLNKEIFNAMSEALKDNKTIKKFIIIDPFKEYFDFSTKEFKDFSKFILEILEILSFNNTITEANIISFKTFDEGAIEMAMAEGLKNNTTLEKLYLSSNRIGNKGATALADALKENNSLKYLDLFNNIIGDEGAKALAEALKTNKSLTTLNINYNNIGDEGAIALAKILTNNTSLTLFNISNNRIGNEGGSALAKALKNNKSLEELDLHGNYDRKFKVIDYEILSSDKRIKFT